MGVPTGSAGRRGRVAIMSEPISSRGIVVWAATLLCTTAAFAQSVPAAPDASDLHHDLAIQATLLQPLEGQHIALPAHSSAASRPQDGTHKDGGTHSPVAGKYDLRRIGQRGVGSGLDFYSLEKERAQ